MWEFYDVQNKFNVDEWKNIGILNYPVFWKDYTNIYPKRQDHIGNDLAFIYSNE